MALFKVSKGASGALNNQALVDGYCWFTYDDGKFYIDYTDPSDNKVKRRALNAEQADKDSLGQAFNSTYAANLDFRKNVLTLIAKDGAHIASVPIETIEDTDAYIFRKTGGNLDLLDIENGAKRIEKLIGDTIYFNQFMSNGNFRSGTTGWQCNSNYANIAVTNGVCTWTCTQAPTSYYQTYIMNSSERILGCPVGHKVFVTADVQSSISTSIALQIVVGSSSTGTTFSTHNKKSQLVDANVWTNITKIFSVSGNPARRAAVEFDSASNITVGTTFSVKDIMVFDLTQMFGETIADQIYAIESENPGNGIAIVKKFFPNNFYPYNTGSLQNVKINSHISTGFNLWDEEWLRGYLDSSTGNFVSYQTVFSSKNFIPIIDSLEYYVYGNIKIFYFDINKTYLTNEWKNNATFTPPPGAAFIRFQADSGTHGAVYSGTGICINISNSEKNGTYEPYCGHTYPLDSSIALNGVLFLDSNNTLAFDGDEYRPDGTIIRKYGKSFYSLFSKVNDYEYETTVSSVLLENWDEQVTNIFLGKYEKVYSLPQDGLTNCQAYVTKSGSSLYIKVHDENYADASSINNFYLSKEFNFIYKLKSPSYESGSQYAEMQYFNDSGIEMFVTDSFVPITCKAYYRDNSYIESNINERIIHGNLGIVVDNSNPGETIIKPKLKSYTASSITAAAATSVTDRQYPVQIDPNGDLSVNVPWETVQLEDNTMVFKGVLNNSSSIPTYGYQAGWTYRIGTAGSYAGEACEVGDILIAVNDGPSSGSSLIAQDWALIQRNVDGPLFSGSNIITENHVIVGGSSIGLVKDSGYSIGTSVPAEALFTDSYIDSVTATGTTNGVDLELSRIGSNTATIETVISYSTFIKSVTTTLTAGTSSTAPKVQVSVNGVTSNTITLTKATTAAYGATKLTETYDSTNNALAATGKAIAQALVTNSKTQAGFVAAGSGQTNKVWKTDEEGNPAWRNNTLDNDLIITIDSGTTEGSSQYTYNGSAEKNLNIAFSNGISLTASTGQVTIGNSGVRNIGPGTQNGTISVDINGITTQIAVTGLGPNAFGSTSYLPLTGGILTGSLTANANVYLNNETYAEDLTTETLLVSGNANFIQIPTSPTPSGISNDNSVATTEFVKSALSSLEGAMQFIGSTTTPLSDGSTTSIVSINGTNITAVSGNIALYEGAQYIFDGSSWTAMGGAYKIKQTAVSSPTASGSATAFISAISQNIEGVITATKVNLNTSGVWTGKANSLNNYPSSRLTDANITHVSNGGVVHFKSTTAMAANRPDGAGNILHFHWDTSDGWDSQLYIPCSTTTATPHSMQWRGHSLASTWYRWKTLLDDENYTKYPIINFGVCETAAATTQKAVTISNSNFTLIDGAIVSIKFLYNNKANIPTLNINSTGEKKIYGLNGIQLRKYGSTSYTGIFYSNQIYQFLYSSTLDNGNGGYYVINYNQAINAIESRYETESLNKSADFGGAGAVFQMFSTSSTTSQDANAKAPMTSAHVLQMNWDNQSRNYNAQIAVGVAADTTINRMFFRTGTTTANTWREIAHSATHSAAVGSSSQPVYMEADGTLTPVSSYGGTAESANQLSTSGTTSQFWRGDNTWSNELTGQLVLSSTSNILVNSVNTYIPLIIGNSEGTHVEFDSNEIVAKTNASTTGVLFINKNGGKVAIGSGSSLTGNGITIEGNEIYSQSSVTVNGLHLNETVTTPVYIGSSIILSSSENSGDRSSIQYSRVGTNYIVVPESANFVIAASGQRLYKDVRFYVDNESVLPNHPQATVSNSVSLGNNSIRWSKIFGVEGSFSSTADSSYSSYSSAGMVLSGGLSVAKQISTKQIRVDNGSSSSGVILQYDTTLNTLNFVFA